MRFTHSSESDAAQTSTKESIASAVGTFWGIISTPGLRIPA
jgi:hypothetical protein